MVSPKWRLFEGKILIQNQKDKGREISIELPDSHIIKCEFYQIVGNHFLVCYGKPLMAGRNGRTTIINSNGEIIFTSDGSYNINQLAHAWYDMLLIDDSFFLDTKGNIFKSPYLQGQHCLMPDNCGFVRYYNGNYFGIADNKGNYISPCIFPVACVDSPIPDPRDNDYSSDDAYEGLSDAKWNTD